VLIDDMGNVAAATTTASHAEQDRIISGALVLRFVSVAASSLGFFLPFGVVPEYAAGVAGASSAGAVTSTFLVVTVIVELASPVLLLRTGNRVGLAAGLLLLGAPTLLLAPHSSSSTIFATCALRGVGFAVTVVAGGALTADLLPRSRRGEGLAVIGLVNGIPALVGLPAGVWIADRYGYHVVFLLTAALPVLAALTVPFLPAPGAPPSSGPAHGLGSGPVGIIAGLRTGRLMRPAAVFAASAAGAGVLSTFLPLAVLGRPDWTAPTALLLLSMTATASRLVAGRLGDRGHHQSLVAPGLTLSVVGVLGVALTQTVPTVLLGAAVFGAGFGTLQNSTLSMMYAEADRPGYAMVSAIWNAAYDGGMAAGTFTVGLLVPLIGYGPAFVGTACLMATGFALPTSHRSVTS
jgi:predicted MFS family arabinose efflux permease